MSDESPVKGPLARLGIRRPERFGPFLWQAGLTTSVLAALLVWLPAGELFAATRRTGLTLWLLLVAGTALGHALNAVKWRILLRATGVNAPIRATLSAHAAGLFANIWLPSLIGGDVVRAGLLARRTERLAPLAGAGVVDRLIDTAALIGLAGVGLAITPEARSAPALRILEVAVAAVIAVAAAAPLALRVVDMRRFGARADALAGRLRSALASVNRSGGASSRALGLSLLVQGSFAALNIPLAAAIGIDVPASVWFMVWPVAKLAALAPVSLGGLGVREVAQVALLAPLGVDPTLAVAQSLVWQSLVLTLGGVAGIASVALQQNGAGVEGPAVVGGP